VRSSSLAWQRTRGTAFTVAQPRGHVLKALTFTGVLDSLTAANQVGEL
jgi:hypothetical protein